MKQEFTIQATIKPMSAKNVRPYKIETATIISAYL